MEKITETDTPEFTAYVNTIADGIYSYSDNILTNFFNTHEVTAEVAFTLIMTSLLQTVKVHMLKALAIIQPEGEFAKGTAGNHFGKVLQNELDAIFQDDPNILSDISAGMDVKK